MSLEKKKKELELAKVECAKQEMELKICESEENIKRLQDTIEIQDKRILEIKEILKELGE